MYIFPFPLALTLLSTLHSAVSTSSPPQLQTVTIHSLPSTSSLTSPAKPLATLTFSPQHPQLSKISNFVPPRASSTDQEEIIQVGICYSGSNDCRTTATLIQNFHPPYKGRFRVVVSKEGKVLSVSWRALLPSSSPATTTTKDDEKKYEEGGRGDFDLVIQSQAPRVWVDKPVLKGRGKAGGGKAEEGKKEGEEEEVDERSFLQKYWWVILAVTVFAMAGGGGDK